MRVGTAGKTECLRKSESMKLDIFQGTVEKSKLDHSPVAALLGTARYVADIEAGSLHTYSV